VERYIQTPSIDGALAETTALARALGGEGGSDRVLGEGTDDLYAELTARVAEIRAHGCRTAC
jgi:hypothetical protein